VQVVTIASGALNIAGAFAISALLAGTAAEGLELSAVCTFFHVEALALGHDCSCDLYSCRIHINNKHAGYTSRINMQNTHQQ
jgi:hypothetical protein